MDGSSTQTKVVIEKRRKTLNSKRRFALTTILILVLVTTSAIFVKLNYFKFGKADECRNKSSSPIYKEARQYLAPDSAGKLGVVVAKITKMKDYQKDPNCVYPIVIYYINVSDARNSRSTLNLLKSLTGTDKYISSDYSGWYYSNDLLEKRVKIIENLAAEAERNFPRR